jgi:PAS domain-containing protein
VALLVQPNEKLVELLLLAETARSLGARHLSWWPPTWPTCARTSPSTRRGGQPAHRGRFLAGLFDALITVDPHLHRVATLHEVVPLADAIVLSGAPLLGELIAARRREVLLLGPDEESLQWVASAAQIHGWPHAVCRKLRHGDREVEIALPALALAGRAVVLMDDVASSGQTLIEATPAAAAAGAASVDVAVTHACSRVTRWSACARPAWARSGAPTASPTPATRCRWWRRWWRRWPAVRLDAAAARWRRGQLIESRGWHDGAASPGRARPESPMLQQLKTFGEILDGLDIAMCVFDTQDRALAWNRCFFKFFPEHEGHVHEGEPYRANLRRFYRAAWARASSPAIEHYIEAGIERHQHQSLPYAFEHLGRRLRVASLPLPEIGRMRLWRSRRRCRPSPPVPGLPAILQTGGTALLDRVPDALMVCGHDGQIEWVNESFAVMYGLRDRHRAGQPLRGRVRGCLVAGAARGGGRLPHRPPGAERPSAFCRRTLRAAAAGQPLQPRDRPSRGRRRGLLCHVDISEFKRQQQRLEAAERLAREREQQLRHKSLLLEVTVENLDQGIC